MALALYRKYRSATFAEVIGQEHVTAPLMQALTANRINHAYLFSGPRGCGKTSSARILARSLNCEQGPTPTPCGVCGSCVDLAPNGSGSIDVIEIDAASHGGVDDARDLRERAYYAPVRDRYKVYIIDEAHMVTTQGFNALLKLVEEPPDFLIFIFATTEPDKVLQTIRSRTHHYPFRLIPPSVLRAHLERICQAEDATVEPAVFPLVVRAGAGSARDSLSVLDQLLAGAGPEGVTYTRAVGLLGVTDAALLDDMTDSLAVGDAAGVYTTIDRVVEAGHDPRRFAADLLERFRDLMVLDAVPDAVEKGMIDYADDQAIRMADQSRRIGLATLVRYADIAHTTLTDMRGTTSPRLMLELLCARMLLPDSAADNAAVLQRLERLERRQAMGLSVDRSAEQSATGQSGRRPRADAETAAGRSAAETATGRSAAGRPGSEPPAPESAAPTESTVGRRPVAETTPEPPVARRVAVEPPVVDAPATKPAATESPIANDLPPAESPQAARAVAAPASTGSASTDLPAAGSAVADLEPASSEPASLEPASSEPASLEPASSEPASLVPASSEPASLEPASSEPASQAATAPPSSIPAEVDRPVAAQAGDSNALRNVWPEVMLALRDRSKVKWAMMNEVIIASVDGEVIDLIAPAGLARRIADDSNVSVLREALQSVVAGNWQLTIRPAPSNVAPDARAAADAPPATSPRASRPARATPAERPAPEPPVDDDGVDEEGDEVSGLSQRAGGDPEAAAIALLQNSLGARPIEGP
ncbi:MAG: DNA polymerase III subunit gamma and tau [Actinomycetota bacterium]|nr:DNA polymerase III subunit gamma and tau [Actinomycetota bacterium]MDQ2955606.1 DNA polymerase III subunit gamma and tau [Actinomycetota bacterium]